MVKHLTRHGNSLALVIEKGVLNLLNIDADTPLAVATDGRRLTITPLRGIGRPRAAPAPGRGADRSGEVGGGRSAGRNATAARPDAGSVLVDRSAEVYAAAVRALTLEQKLRVSEGLREVAWRVKAGSLARRHPEWSKEELNRRVGEAFLRGRA